MKKKIAICALLGLSVLGLSACGKNSFNLNDYIIEQREQLFTASDNLYSVSLSTGTRECDYNFDGVVNEMVPFGVLTITRNDNNPLATTHIHISLQLANNLTADFFLKATQTIPILQIWKLTISQTKQLMLK